jgi:hypothetical protein
MRERRPHFSRGRRLQFFPMTLFPSADVDIQFLFLYLVSKVCIFGSDDNITPVVTLNATNQMSIGELLFEEGEGCINILCPNVKHFTAPFSSR